MSNVESVDIAALWSDNRKERETADQDIWQALAATGGLIISGYPGVEFVDKWARIGVAIHDAPEAVKRALTIAVYQRGNDNYYRGYHPMLPGSTFKVSIYDIGPPEPANGPDLPGMEYMTEPTPWPKESAMPGWREAMSACYTHMNQISQRVMLSIGRSAGFSEDVIMQRFSGEHSTLRLLDYPDIDHSDTQGIAAYRHVDASALSLLWQREPGLQAEGPDGVFYDVPMIPNCVSVHVGTVMEKLTAGKVRATPHRVLGSPGNRRSMGFFLEPKLTAPLTAANEATEEITPLVQDTYAWLLLKTHHSREKYADLIPDPETPITT